MTRTPARAEPGAVIAVVAVIVVIVVIVAMGVGLGLRDRTAHSAPTAGSPTPAAGTVPPPAIVRTSALETIDAQLVRRLDEPIEWAQTTAARWYTLRYPAVRHPTRQQVPVDAPIYLIQIRGDFVCRTCKGVWTTPPAGAVIVLEIPVDADSGIAYGFNLVGAPYALATAGPVHTFTAH